MKGATSYFAELSPDSGTTWTTITTQPGTTFAETGIAASTLYQFRVTATNATGNSVTSSIASATTLPTPPTGLTATGQAGPSVHLSWSPITHATSYVIQRSTDQNSWTTLSPNPALGGSAGSYTDSAVQAGATYYYRVESINTYGTSVWTTTVSALTVPASSALSETAASATSISLLWTSVASATSYLLESSTDSGTTWSTVVTQTGVAYTNSGLTAGTTYEYRVTAINASGNSPVSSTTTAATLLVPPASFAATAANATTLNLTWAAVSGATSYTILRSRNQNTWTALVPATALTGSSVAYADTAVSAATTYYYKIESLDSAGASAPSAAVHALSDPPAPTLAAIAASATSVSLTWNAVPSAQVISWRIPPTAPRGTPLSPGPVLAM